MYVLRLLFIALIRNESLSLTWSLFVLLFDRKLIFKTFALCVVLILYGMVCRFLMRPILDSIVLGKLMEAIECEESLRKPLVFKEAVSSEFAISS